MKIGYFHWFILIIFEQFFIQHIYCYCTCLYGVCIAVEVHLKNVFVDIIDVNLKYLFFSFF